MFRPLAGSHPTGAPPTRGDARFFWGGTSSPFWGHIWCGQARETKRQIEAKIVDKKLDDSEANVVFRDGKVAWLKTEKLSQEDQAYIKNWIKPEDHISARVIVSRKRRKEIEVTAIAGSRSLTVKELGTAGQTS